MITFELTPALAAVAALLGLLLAFICVLHLLQYARPLDLKGKLGALASWRLPAWARPVTAIACIPVGLLLVEYPYSASPCTFDMAYIWPNLLIAGLAFGVIFFACQRSRCSMVAFLLACFAIGVSSYYVAQFKGLAIMPSDVASLGTARAVMGGYDYAIDDRIGAMFVLLEAMSCLCALLPKRKAKNMEAIIVNCLFLALVSSYAAYWWADTNIEEECEVTVSAWDTLSSFRAQGFLLSFLDCVQQLAPTTPEGYSAQAASDLRASTIANSSSSRSGASASMQSPPSVIVVMNESFADYSGCAAIDDSYAGPTAFKSIAAGSLLHGDVYVSAMSGGTCNSEFEFLTGSTMGMLGTGVYPYTFYDLAQVDNLVRNFNALGYQTTAIHPASAYNWRRDQVYAQLGFDGFISGDSFENADTRRNYVTDAETYKVVFDQLLSSDEPQFIFDVTIANHGGYGSGSIPADERISALVNGEVNEELDEYLSCIAYSDAEFADFISTLEKLERPVVVCMFGDHQPYFADELASRSFGLSVNDMGIEQRQARYTTPYLIWTNSDELGATRAPGELNMSLNYLGAVLMDTMGLPLDDYFLFLLETRKSLPAINLNGFMDEDGTWRWFVENGMPSTYEAKSRLKIVQYDNLFKGKSS